MDEAPETATARSAIIEVVNRYGAAVDARDMALLRSCFADSAILQFPTRSIEGPDAIVTYLENAIPWVAWQQHLLGSHQVTVDGDRAKATCSVLATQVPTNRDDPVKTTIGTYTDDLIRTPEGWKIAHRSFHVGYRNP